MNEKQLKKLLDKPQTVDEKIKFYIKKRVLIKQDNDILFYVQSKQEREKASYSSQIAFDKKLVSDLRLKTLMFVNKGKEIIEKSS